MKKNLLALAFLVGLLTCCKSEDAPIKPVKPTDPGSINKEYMSRAETTFANIFKYYWSDKVRMMFGSYPNTLGTPQEPSSPDYTVTLTYGDWVASFRPSTLSYKIPIT